MNFRAAQAEDGPEMARLLNAARHFPLVTAEDCSAQLQSGSGVRAWMGAGGDAYVQYYLHPYNGPMFWCACQPQESARDCLNFIESQAEDSFMLVVADKFPVLLKHLEERNYRQISQELAQTLEIAQFNSDLEALDRARADGFLFTTLDQLEDSKVIDSLFEFEQESAADVPNAKIQRRPDRREFQQRLEQQKAHHPFWSLALLRGQIVAQAQHVRRGQDYFYSFGTGVRRKFRGRGLARAVKLFGLEQLRASGARRVDTSNDSQNFAMLHVNRALGFQPLGLQFYFASPGS